MPISEKNFQKLVIIATGRGASRSELEFLNTLATEENYSALVTVVNDYFGSVASKYGTAEALNLALNHGFSIDKASNEAETTANALDAGVLSWADYLSEMIFSNSSYSSVLEARADSAIKLLQRLDEERKSDVFLEPAFLLGVKTLMQGINTNSLEHIELDSYFDPFVSSLRDEGISVSVSRLNDAIAFIDNDGNGVKSNDEINLLLGESNRFLIPYSVDKGTIVVSGGIDRFSDKAFESSLKAPIGATIVNSQTTLFQSFLDADYTISESLGFVEKLLGFPVGISPFDYDPLLSIFDKGASKEAINIPLVIEKETLAVSTFINLAKELFSADAMPESKISVSNAIESLIVKQIIRDNFYSAGLSYLARPDRTFIAIALELEQLDLTKISKQFAALINEFNTKLVEASSSNELARLVTFSKKSLLDTAVSSLLENGEIGEAVSKFSGENLQGILNETEVGGSFILPIQPDLPEFVPIYIPPATVIPVIPASPDPVITAAQANELDAATSGVVTAMVSDTASNLATLTGTGNAYTVTVSDSHNLLELKAINAATTGPITLTDLSVTLTGLFADIAAALTGISSYSGDLVATDSALTIAQANELDAATSGTVTATLNDTASNLATLTGTDNAYTVTVSDSHNLAQLKAINAATTGPITLTDLSVTLYGSVADITAALEGISSYAGTLLPNDPRYTAAQVNALLAATTGLIDTVGSEVGLIDTASNLLTITESGRWYGATVSDSHNLAQLKAINAALGVIYLNDYSIALTGSFADIKAALTDIRGYTGSLTATDSTLTAAQANELNAATSGVVTATLSDTASNLNSLEGTGNAYTVAITGAAATLPQLKWINNATEGSVTLNDQTNNANFSGSASDLSAAFEGVSTLLGAITLIDESTIDEANQLLLTTAGPVSLNLEDSYINGGTLSALRTGDIVDVDFSNQVSGFGLGSASSAAQVTGASDWHFDQSTGLFTWWNTVQQTANSITLTGVGTIAISTDGFTVATTGTGISYAVETTSSVDTVVINTGNSDYPIIYGFDWGTDKIDLTLVETVANANGDSAAVTDGVNNGSVAIATLAEVDRIPYASQEELFIAERDLSGITKNSALSDIISEGLAQLGSNGINAGVPLAYGEGALIMMDNGTDSFLFLVQEKGGSSEIGAGELTLVAIFDGLGAENISSIDFI